jgi:hypothetical protein
MEKTNTNGTLENIRERIGHFEKQVVELAHKLREHADAVHGTVPQPAVEQDGLKDQPPGLISRIHVELDDLDTAIGRLAQEAGRNSTLA